MSGYLVALICLLKKAGFSQPRNFLVRTKYSNVITFEVVVGVLDDPDHDVLVLAGGGEQLAAVRELHAPDGAEVRRLQLLRELDVLKVEGARLVRLDPLEPQLRVRRLRRSSSDLIQGG